MASYTMTLGEVMELLTHEQVSSTRDRIELGRTKLFDFDYPIFDPDYKKVFETHFIRKFYMREIGFETDGLFKFQLETWLIINMPYFNKMFESELLEYNPLENSKINVTRNKEKNKTQNDDRDTTTVSNTTGTSDSTSSQDNTGSLTVDDFNRELNSDTPDSRLALTANDGEGVIEYASSIREKNENNKSNSTSNTDETSNTSTDVDSNATQNDTLVSTVNDIEDYIESKTGKTGHLTYSQMVKEFRQSFLRVENQIFDEMQELFMGVY